MAGLFSQTTLEQVRAASDIVDVIGGYLPLKRAGGNFVTLCPFHREKSPSFNVNPHRQIFHCFGCHKGGDVFTFIREYESLSFIEAVKRLAERAPIPIEFDSSGGGQATYLKDKLLQIHEQIAHPWQTPLPNHSVAPVTPRYLAEPRGSAVGIDPFWPPPSTRPNTSIHPKRPSSKKAKSFTAWTRANARSWTPASRLFAKASSISLPASWLA